MRRISAHYIFTSSGKPIKMGIITLADDDTVISVEDHGGRLTETAGVEFYNGIIIPGLVNCHCHLELSHMHETVEGGNGLADFVSAIRDRRISDEEEIINAAASADRNMYDSGISACGDISNTEVTFGLKSQSPVKYVTFIEVFGIDPAKAGRRIEDAVRVAKAADVAGIDHYITPHAVYSVSDTLFPRIEEFISGTSVTSIHFLESEEERELVDRHAGKLADSYIPLGIEPDRIRTWGSHLDVAHSLSLLTGNLILVHNTVITGKETEELNKLGNVWYCLCPASNLHISTLLPPVELIYNSGGRIVIGTDSLASSHSLSLLDQMKLLQGAAPDIPLEEIVRWGTINGAIALGLERVMGSVEPGKRPGLVLLENTDLNSLRLLPETTIRRLT